MAKSHAQLDREIAEALAATREPLYGHTSEATAYVVDDYPYGFRERTQIRYWLEHKPGKGWRFVSQTMNPQTGRWNKPKASTYSDWGGAMYKDEKGHVHWDGIGAYSDEGKILAFVKSFPEAKTELKKVVPAKKKLLQGLISGDRYFTINGVKQPASEKDIERWNHELAIWDEIESSLR